MAKPYRLPKPRYIIANPIKRIAAFLVDLLILQIIVLSAFSSYFESIFPKEKEFLDNYAYLSGNVELFANAYYALIAIGVLFLLYFAYLEYKYSQTVGMMIFKLYAESSEGKELTFLQCILRNIYVIPLFPIFFLWVLDPLFFLFKGERLSERFSKTKTTEEDVTNENYF